MTKASAPRAGQERHDGFLLRSVPVSLGAILVTLAGIFVVIPAPTRSGIIPTYLSVPATLALGGILILMWALGRYQPSRHYRHMAWMVLLFLTWFLVVSFLRSRFGWNVAEGALALRTTLLPVAICFMFDLGLDKPERALRALVWLNCGANLWQLSSWNNIRLSSFLGNTNIYCGAILLMLPINVWIISRSRRRRADRVLAIVAWFNVFIALVIPIWGGSRMIAVLLAGSLLACIVMYRRQRRILLMLAILILPAFALHAVVWNFNPANAAYGLYRLIDTPSAVDFVPSTDRSVDPAQQPSGTLESVTVAPGERSDPQVKERAELNERAKSEKARSDKARSDLRKDSLDRIEKNFWIGDGVVYFEYEDSAYKGKQTAHNFILEHINAYGFIGFLLYLGIFAVVLSPGLGAIRSERGIENMTVLVVVGTLFTLSLVQPTMLNPLLVTLLYVIVGGLKHKLLNGTTQISEQSNSLSIY